MSRFRDRYGSGPTHLAAHLIGFALMAFAFSQILQAREALNAVIWIVAAALIHDLVFVPGYSALDRIGQTASSPVRPPFINHARFALIVSGVLLLVYFPLIFNLAPANYFRATGEQPADYAAHWLRITAAILLLTVLAYVVRLLLWRNGRVKELEHPVAATADKDAPGA